MSNTDIFENHFFTLGAGPGTQMLERIQEP